MIYKTLHRKLRIGKHESHYNKGKQFLFHLWHPSCYCCCKPGDTIRGSYLLLSYSVPGFHQIFFFIKWGVSHDGKQIPWNKMLSLRVHHDNLNLFNFWLDLSDLLVCVCFCLFNSIHTVPKIQCTMWNSW